MGPTGENPLTHQTVHREEPKEVRVPPEKSPSQIPEEDIQQAFKRIQDIDFGSLQVCSKKLEEQHLTLCKGTHASVKMIDPVAGSVTPTSKKHPQNGETLWIDFEDPNPKTFDWLEQELGIQKDEVESLYLSEEPHTMVKTHGSYILCKSFEFTLNPQEETKVQRTPIVMIIGQDRLITLHHGSSEIVDSFQQTANEGPRVFGGTGTAAVAYRFFRSELEHNEETIHQLLHPINQLREQLRTAPLTPESITSALPNLIDGVAEMRTALSGQKVIPAALTAFFDTKVANAAYRAAKAFTDRHSEALNILETELQHSLDQINALHQSSAANRIALIAKKVAILSAIALPQLVVSGFFSQQLSGFLQAGDSVVAIAHVAALGVTAALLYLAKKKHWM